jgi:hypothetical protein
MHGTGHVRSFYKANVPHPNLPSASKERTGHHALVSRSFPATTKNQEETRRLDLFRTRSICHVQSASSSHKRPDDSEDMKKKAIDVTWRDRAGTWLRAC